MIFVYFITYDYEFDLNNLDNCRAAASITLSPLYITYHGTQRAWQASQTNGNHSNIETPPEEQDGDHWRLRKHGWVLLVRANDRGGESHHLQMRHP